MHLQNEETEVQRVAEDQKCYQFISPGEDCSSLGLQMKDIQYTQVSPAVVEAAGTGLQGQETDLSLGHWVVLIKCLDLVFNLYLSFLVGFCLFLNISVLLQQVGE